MTDYLHDMRTLAQGGDKWGQRQLPEREIFYPTANHVGLQDGRFPSVSLQLKFVRPHTFSSAHKPGWR